MTHPSPDFPGALSARYRLERELGAGGSAIVYLAHDLRHDRPVALKVLRPEVAATVGPSRFLREIRLVARLQHPHILSVHDSGESDGLLWFAMPFVAGESLRERLRREGRLTVPDALHIAFEVGRALDYAHRQGVIHRDIKPENILLTAEHDILLADFGIGRRVGARAPGEHVTRGGAILGTPAYMSPEQVLAESELDGRTDVYSLGCVLYEMLAGEPPFHAPTAQGMLTRRLTEQVPSVRERRPEVPDWLDQVLRRAMAPGVEERFASAGELTQALAEGGTSSSSPGTFRTPPGYVGPPRRSPARARHAHIVLAVLLVLVPSAALGWAVWERTRGTPAQLAAPRRIAVLPFDNMGVPQDEYFAAGITDEVRGKLATLPGLQVTARSSAGQYANTSKPPQQVGRELNVDYLLTATVRWDKATGAASRVRVSPELIHVPTGSTYWQRSFDAVLSDVFQVQADIASRVAQALDLALSERDQRRLTEQPTANLAAYDAFLQAEEISDRVAVNDPVVLRRAIAYYEQAVALDPGFAAAWSQLSRAHSVVYLNGTPTPAGAAAARTAAERAVAVAPQRAEGRLALGDFYAGVEKNYERALEQYAAGRRVAPSDPELIGAAALAELSLGRWEAAVGSLQQSLELDPRAVTTARRLARVLLWLRRYPEAIEAANRALALAPTNLDAIQTKAMVRLAQGDLEGARMVLRSAPTEVEPTALVANMAAYWDLFWVLDDSQQQLLLRLTPGPFDDNRYNWALALAATHSLRGNAAKARAYADSARIAVIDQLRSAPDDGQLHALHGLALAYLGRKTDAVREGERAVELVPVSQDNFAGPYLQHQLVRICTLVGDHECAVRRLEELLDLPYYLSPGWLRIDPTFGPLRRHPRFLELLARGS